MIIAEFFNPGKDIAVLRDNPAPSEWARGQPPGSSAAIVDNALIN
ncbi:MAG: hypothetical protein JWQ13_1491 [Ramlibacter sp.]|jgi:hypothetical protein|nr:hypothetical protein [Ramlibacter sp.]